MHMRNAVYHVRENPILLILYVSMYIVQPQAQAQ